MIKNDRQFAATRRQLSLLENALLQPAAPAPDVHPLLAEAGREGIREQAADLRAEIEEYEGLRDGRIGAPDLDVLSDLPRNLVRARLARGLSQKSLADRLGIAEQQVQRYEANDYAGASLSRLREIARALSESKIDVSRASVEGPSSADNAALVRRLTELGLDGPVARRLVLPVQGGPGNIADATSLAAKALGVEPEDLVRDSVRELVGAGARFKVGGKADYRRTNAYAAYARTIAGIVVKSTASTVSGHLGGDPEHIRAIASRGSGDVTFRDLLDYCWTHGVAVLPLPDSAAFHAAYWRISGRHVVVLKQRTASADRWAFDLGHELCHASDADFDDLPDSQAAVVDDENAPGWADDPEEVRANKFAAALVLGPNAESLALEAAETSGGRVEALKRVVPLVAKRAGVSTGALANYVAFRLRGQGINWWASAAGLQDRRENPWRTARDALLEHIDFSSLDRQERILLVDALSEWRQV